MNYILNKKHIGIIILLFFCLLPIQTIKAQTTNAGFIPGNIWYSQDPFEEGDTIRVYTAIFNPDKRELSGTVVFFDNNVFLAKKDFIVETKSVRDVSVDWTVTVGDHNIFGKIENAKFLISQGKYEEVYLAENQTVKSSHTINKKIIAQTPILGDAGVVSKSVNSILESVGSAGQNSINSVGKIIENNVPAFISEPINLTTNAVETFRQGIANASKNGKEVVKKEIDVLNSNIDNQSSKQNTKKTPIDALIKPYKFTELFALALFSNIFDNKFIFYTLLFLFIFLILRYLIIRFKKK